MKNESGRTMVEMLGVLAIMGVLSVGGIAGYTSAMRKYKANEIAKAISITAMLAKTANAGVGVTENSNYETLTGDPLPVGANRIEATVSSGEFNNQVRVATGTDQELCNAVRMLIGTTASNPLSVSAAEADKCGKTYPYILVNVNAG